MKYFYLVLACLIIYFVYTKLPEREHYKGEGYVSVVCNGQLGNQMFKIASTLAYAWDHNLKPVFPSLNNPGDNLIYNRDRFFGRLDCSEAPVTLKEYQLPVLNYAKLPEMNDVLMEGGFFSYRYFDHHRNRLLDVFAPSEKLLDEVITKYGDLVQKENTVAIHVRTYSKITHATGLHFVGLEYFANAMEYFPQDSLFVVFTDRAAWTKHHFQKRFPKKNFVFIEGNDHLVDLILMSKMKHHILSNSTYSWWAAYLNQNPNKLVVHPVLKSNWWTIVKKTIRPVANLFRSNPPMAFRDEEYYMPDWKAVEYLVQEYPEDMNHFADESKSVFSGDK